VAGRTWWTGKCNFSLKQERERPTHIEVLSVCIADAAIQSNPIPIARYPTVARIRTYERIVFLSRGPDTFSSGSQYNFAFGSNRRKLRLVTEHTPFSPFLMILESLNCVRVPMIYIGQTSILLSLDIY